MILNTFILRTAFALLNCMVAGYCLADDLDKPFGVQLGSPLKESMAIAYKDHNQTFVTKFDPLERSMLFKDYDVTVTRMSKTVLQISAVFHEHVKCETYEQYVSDVLAKDPTLSLTFDSRVLKVYKNESYEFTRYRCNEQRLLPSQPKDNAISFSVKRENFDSLIRKEHVEYEEECYYEDSPRRAEWCPE